MQAQPAEGELAPPQPAAVPEVEAVPEKGQDEEGGGHAGGVDGEQAGAPQGRAGGGGTVRTAPRMGPEQKPAKP